MRLGDAEDLWLCCVCQAPKYADHSLVSDEHLSARARSILEAVRRVHSEGWPMVTPDQLQDVSGLLRTIPRRMHAVDAQSTIEQAERALIDAWANGAYQQALHEAADVCGAKGREAAEGFLWGATAKLQSSAAGVRWMTTGEIVERLLERLRKRMEEGESANIGSGMEAIDRAVRWWPASRCTTIGGYTNDGKSTLKTQLLTGLALRGVPTASIDLEDEDTLTAKRQLAMLVDELAAVQRLSEDKLEPCDLDLFESLLEDGLRELPMDVIYAPTWGIDQVCHAVHDAVRRGARVVAVDYLQCLHGPGNRAQFLGECAKRIKAAGCSLGAHVILISQLSRPQDKGKRLPRPTMFMFKETGDVENLTDYALLPFRPGKGQAQGIERATVYIDKAKDGPTGVIHMGWDTARNVFTVEPPDEADGGQRDLGRGGWTHEPRED